MSEGADELRAFSRARRLALQVTWIRKTSQLGVSGVEPGKSSGLCTPELGHPTRHGHCHCVTHGPRHCPPELHLVRTVYKSRELPRQVKVMCLLVVGATQFPKNDFLEKLGVDETLDCVCIFVDE